MLKSFKFQGQDKLYSFMAENPKNNEGARATNKGYAVIWSMFQKQGNFEGSILCNLYACCKSRERFKKPILKIINFFVESLSDESTFVTYAGDWGIEKNNYDTILKAPHQKTPYFNINTEEITPHVKRWFSTNLKQDIHEKIYPVPINAFVGNWKKIQIDPLRKIRKDKIVLRQFCHNI